MWYEFLGRRPVDEIQAHAPSQEIRDATHALNNAASRLDGALRVLKREQEALAEFERRLKGGHCG